LIFSDSFKPDSRDPSTQDPDFLGKLVLLKEAAGKTRVIAVVDPLTQWVLKPLHKYLMAILSKIPQDGAFNQTKPITLLYSRVRKYSDKFIGCADMSAATDRLPVVLQEKLLAVRMGQKYSLSWRMLLTKRFYVKGMMVPFMYSVGQPMGAYSS